MRAVFSDIHANWHALKAVLADIATSGAEYHTCLGDIVGYGANPNECLETVISLPNCDSTLGNHDNAAVFDPEGFNGTAEQAIFWTRAQIESAPNGEALYNFICSMPFYIETEQVIYCHGSPSSPINEYVFPEDAWNKRKMDRIFDRIKRLGFCGHTHVPGIFYPKDDGYVFEDQQTLGTQKVSLKRYPKALVNVGSVGQPRDDCFNSRYVLFDEENMTVEFREVPYDIEGAQTAIYQAVGLPDYSAERLAPSTQG